MLVADDSAVPRLILERSLRALGHETISVVDGNEAWAIYPVFQPDVVLSDWLMPGMDGIELCGRIRATQADRYTYFVLVTAMTEVEHVITAMAAGSPASHRSSDRGRESAGPDAPARVRDLPCSGASGTGRRSAPRRLWDPDR